MPSAQGLAQGLRQLHDVPLLAQGTQSTLENAKAKKPSGGMILKRRTAYQTGVYVSRTPSTTKEDEALSLGILLNEDIALVAKKKGVIANVGGFSSTNILAAYQLETRRHGLRSHASVKEIISRAIEGARVLSGERGECRLLYLSVERRSEAHEPSELHQDSCQRGVFQFVACLKESGMVPPLGIVETVMVSDEELFALYSEHALATRAREKGIHPALLLPPGRVMRLAQPLSAFVLKLGDIIVFRSTIPHYSPAGSSRDLLFGVLSFSETATFNPDAERMVPSRAALDVARNVTTAYKNWELWDAEGVDVSQSLMEPVSDFIKAYLRKRKRKQKKSGKKVEEASQEARPS